MSFPSAHKATSWKGLNTALFYEKVFEEWGIITSGKGKVNEVELKKVLTNYPIPLLGVPVRYKGEPVGVIKVEFPTTGHSLRQFDESDGQFLQRAAKVFAPELAAITSMVAGNNWFGSMGTDETELVFKRYLEIKRTALVREGESNAFFLAEENFLNEKDITRAAQRVVGTLSEKERNQLVQILRKGVKGLAKDISIGLGQGIGQKLIELLLPK